jgi:hypothetical protein
MAAFASGPLAKPLRLGSRLVRAPKTSRAGLVGLPMVVLAISLCAMPVVPFASSATPAGRIVWTACGEQLDCAEVRVPLDWARPNGRKLSLAVIRHRASHPEQRIGSLFFNRAAPASRGWTP